MESLSARRAWIEIPRRGMTPLERWSLSARRAWIEIAAAGPPRSWSSRSLSARRAWIEMPSRCICCGLLRVALRKESVDRNAGHDPAAAAAIVALRKESVDRNTVVVNSPTDAISRSPQGERG